jgi:hypothetical protein
MLLLGGRNATFGRRDAYLSAADGDIYNLFGGTWLILPVIICLSQRLSHACLSISIIQRDCGRLIKSVIISWTYPFTWIPVVILELIHEKAALRCWHLRDGNQPGQPELADTL